MPAPRDVTRLDHEVYRFTLRALEPVRVPGLDPVSWIL